MSGFKVEQIKTLYAFDKGYEIKKLLSKVLIGKWKPNNIIIRASI